MNYQNQNQNYTQRPPKPNNNTGLIVAISVLSCMLIIALVFVVLVVTGTSYDTIVTVPNDTVTQQPVQPPATQQPAPQPQQPVQQPAPQPQQPVQQPAPQPQQPATSSKKSEYTTRASEIETYESNNLATATTQLDINQQSYIVYEKWDNLLNEIYQYLKTTMPANEFKQLEKDELNWIEEKEKAVAAAAAEWEGGSGEPMIRYGTATRYTKDRCYYLISLVK